MLHMKIGPFRDGWIWEVWADDQIVDGGFRLMRDDAVKAAEAVLSLFPIPMENNWP